MRKGVDGGYGGRPFLGIWDERMALLMRRLGRPYFRVGFILSVCLSSVFSLAQEEWVVSLIFKVNKL